MTDRTNPAALALQELEAAHQIIRIALNLMSPEQKDEWAKRNAAAGCIGEGTTRASERESVIQYLKTVSTAAPIGADMCQQPPVSAHSVIGRSSAAALNSIIDRGNAMGTLEHVVDLLTDLAVIPELAKQGTIELARFDLLICGCRDAISYELDVMNRGRHD